MLTLNDGRAELWQWDTGRTLAVDADCSQLHFSNKVFGRSIDVDVVDGTAIIPDILLQTDKDLNVWAFVGTAENGYTKISKTFKVNRRNKPADYVFTPTDQMTIQTIQSQIGDLADLTTEAKDTLVAAINEAARTGGGGGGSTVELDTTLTQSGKAADAKAVGDEIRSLSEEKVAMPVDAGGTVQNGISGQILQSNGDGTTQWVNKPSGGSSSGITDINIKKWVGKKIVIDGSSITAGGTGNTVPVWGSFLKDMFALAECYNHAVSGTGWFFGGNSYVVDRVDSYENDADAVILMGDYNGIYAYTSNAGAIDDAPAADGSYYAKLKYLAEKLITKYPMCPVIWVVEPPRGAQGDGKTPMDYASGYALQSKCIEEVADYYGFTHCNLMKSTIFRPWNETNYAATTSDGTHPWNNIQRTMAQVIAETMKRTPLIYNESYVNTPGDSSGGTTEDDSDKTLTKITATFTQGDAIIKTTDELDILRNYLRVVATYSDLSEATVTDYTLSGELTEGTSTITVSYGTATTTFNVNVTLDDGSVTVALGDVIDASLIGYYFDNYGNPTAREGMRISQYLPVLGGTDITLSGNLTYPNITKADIVYYDAGKKKIGNANHVYGTVTFTVPDGTSYFRISFDDDDDTKTITYFPG